VLVFLTKILLLSSPHKLSACPPGLQSMRQLTPFVSIASAHFAQTGQPKSRPIFPLFNPLRTLAQNNGGVPFARPQIFMHYLISANRRFRPASSEIHAVLRKKIHCTPRNMVQELPLSGEPVRSPRCPSQIRADLG
jgi:hypothetical protein